jgi:hypothetical protein
MVSYQIVFGTGSELADEEATFACLLFFQPNNA